MSSENINNIVKSVAVTLPNNITPSENDILNLVTALRNAFPVSEEEFNKVIRILHSKYQISMEVGTVVTEDDHDPWLLARKPEIDPYYWDRYEKYLIKSNWPPKVVATLNRVTDDILDLVGDPKKSGSWRRRGLVMGDVQSGKTATYTALCCKAADAGYPLIILLTGTLESLRRQTQERLDAGFVGLDSSDMLQHQQNKAVGVGTIDYRRAAGVFTSYKTDFKSDLINRLGFKLNSFNEPILVVVKKNSRILENLKNWLRSYNADSNGYIDMPVLMIDDEADNASVKTTPMGQEPTAINRGIRALLQLFTRSSYVGFTATPFANIFIDPDTEDEMLGDDLFPRDFIYSLEAPSNYVGADSIFNEGGFASNSIRLIEDAHEIFPPSHRSYLYVEELPSSLDKALQAFILSNAIRDLREEGATHRSMLVNVSRFTNVQEQVASLLDQRLRQIQQDIRNYSQLNPAEACLNKTINSLRDIWQEEFANGENGWEQVQRALLKAALPITVKSVNQRSGASSLDYAANKSTGLRVVAVGGNSLSRGLTLEGLCISYFYRNSQMYDTLMQMGRWFGYRDGYSDLCRIWMTEEARQWYSHIARATRELRNEIRRMQADRLAPKDFGLKVRAHPDSLIVTARNKMRTARTIERLISLSEEGLETPRLYSDLDTIKANARVVKRFLNELKESGREHEESPYKNIIWKKVPKSYITSLLREFTIHPLNLDFQGESIASFLETTNESKLDLWDVVIPNPNYDGEVKSFAGIQYRPQRRKVEGRRDFMLVSGRSARVGSRGIEKEGLDEEQIQAINEKYDEEGKSVPDKAYRKVRERPLLLLHFIEAKKDGQTLETGGVPLIALGLSFPSFDDSKESKRVKYKVNTVEWRNMFENEADDDEDVDDE
jgi:hypothetical protein